LDSQRDACFRKAKELGYEVDDAYIVAETYTGLPIDRPGLSCLRESARTKKIDAIIAYTLDRLSRNPMHFRILQDEMERAGVDLILVTEDLDSSDIGKLVSYIKGYAAKLEAEKIRERTM
jgi:site-specific DNA recombinase